MKKSIYIVNAAEWDDIDVTSSWDSVNLAACETKEIAENYIKNLTLKDINDLPLWGVDNETTTEKEAKDGIRSFSSEDGRVEITIRWEKLDLLTERS